MEVPFKRVPFNIEMEVPFENFHLKDRNGSSI
jgi:hypothetical protein